MMIRSFVIMLYFDKFNCVSSAQLLYFRLRGPNMVEEVLLLVHHIINLSIYIYIAIVNKKSNKD
jgi:hypothetical protein